MSGINQPVMKVPYKGRELVYAIVSDHTAWRVRTMFSKEPDTIAWIESMAPGEVFVDIGANMGIYTVFAAANGLKVHAFEPEAENYNLLCKSIAFSELDAQAYCVALSDKYEASWLYLSGRIAGGSCHTVGENIDHRLTQRDYEVKQGVISVPLDSLNIKADHIKIDVDGLEHLVVEGGSKTILYAQSVLVEINENLPQHMELCEWFNMNGFTVDEEQVQKARRTEGIFKGCGNRIFVRS